MEAAAKAAKAGIRLPVPEEGALPSHLQADGLMDHLWELPWVLRLEESLPTTTTSS